MNKKIGWLCAVGLLWASSVLAFQCEVLELSGEVLVRHSSGEQRAVRQGDLLGEDDILETRSGASVELSFDDQWDNVAHVESDTTIKISQVQPARLDLERGGLYAKLKNLPKDSSFEVRTPTAVASVRGTEFRTLFDGNKAEVYNFSDSLVYVYGVSDSGERASAPQILTRTQKMAVSSGGLFLPANTMSLSERVAGEAIAGQIDESVHQAMTTARVSKIGLMESAASEKVGEQPDRTEAEKKEPEEDWDREVADAFSADMTMIGAQGQAQASIHVAPGRARMEMAGSTSIVRMDRGVVWVLLPAQNMYIEQPISSEMAAQANAGTATMDSRTFIGEEALEGETAKKYEVTFTNSGQTQTVYQWLVKGKPVPVKMAPLDGSWEIFYRNVKIGPIPDALFELPGGYQKMEMPTLPQNASEAADLQRQLEELKKTKS